MKAIVSLLVVVLPLLAKETPYDPSRISDHSETRLTSFEYGGREVPLKVYLPKEKPASVILLSHGLGGSREVGSYLGEHWAARGFLVVAMQHAGSDESVWKEIPPAQRMRALPPSDTPTATMRPACRLRKRRRIQSISSKSPEW